MTETNNKTIAKNTVFLYIRMGVSMLVSLYTSRVLLQALGVDDYGIYQAVGGIVGFLAFINGALATGTSRFLTYSIGEGDPDRMKKMFSMAFYLHLGIALLIAIIAETAGLWYLNHKMVIPPERMQAASIVFHISILSTFFGVTQIPYTACLIAHEKIDVFAYVGLSETFLKLFLVFLLVLFNYDKMVMCAILFLILSAGVFCFYSLYCVRHFEEVQHEFQYDKTQLKDFLGFSGWSLFANIALALNGQGALLLLNLFFSPAVITARSVSLQVNGAAGQLVNNFQTAANPQIVKKYAVGDSDGSKRLLLLTTRFSFFLMLLTCVPIYFTAEPLLRFWLGIVPEYSVVFLKLAVIQSLVCVFDTSFYKALYAKGRLKENAILSPSVLFISFPIAYVLFRMGFSPVALSWVTIGAYAIISFIVKPLLLIKIVDYSWKEIIDVIIPCLIVTVLSVPLPLAFVLLYKNPGSVVGFILTVVVAIVSVIVSCWFFGMDKGMRNSFLLLVRNRFTR